MSLLSLAWLIEFPSRFNQRSMRKFYPFDFAFVSPEGRTFSVLSRAQILAFSRTHSSDQLVGISISEKLHHPSRPQRSSQEDLRVSLDLPAEAASNNAALLPEGAYSLNLGIPSLSSLLQGRGGALSPLPNHAIQCTKGHDRPCGSTTSL